MYAFIIKCVAAHTARAFHADVGVPDGVTLNELCDTIQELSGLTTTIRSLSLCRVVQGKRTRVVGTDEWEENRSSYGFPGEYSRSRKMKLFY